MKSFTEQSDTEPFKKAFVEAFEKKMQEHPVSAAALIKGLNHFFPPAKVPTLPTNVVEAVSLYSQPSHVDTFQEWVRTKNKGAVDEKGRSLVHYAAKAGKIALVNYFIKHHYPLEIEDNKGMTPLIYAVSTLVSKKEEMRGQRQKVIACVDALSTAGAGVFSPTRPLKQNALALAAMYEDLEVVQLLVEQHDADLTGPVFGESLLWLVEHSKNAATNPVIPYIHEKLGQSKSASI